MNTETETTQETIQVPRSLPLWRDWMTKNEDRIKFGATFTVAEFATYLDLDTQSAEFAFAMLEIRRALRHRGMNFTARGGRGETYAITPPAQNSNELRRMQASAINALKQGVILGTNTPIDMLSADEARRHESEVHRVAVRLALMGRKSIAAATKAMAETKKLA